MLPAIETTARLLVFGLMAGLALFAAHGLAGRFTSARTPAVRACATAASLLWLLVALFHLLALPGWFRIAPALAALALLAVVGRRKTGGGATSPTVFPRAEILLFWRSLSGHVRLVAGAAVALVLLRLLRAAVAPPLSWDALVYHFVTIARWVRTGGFVPERVPDYLLVWEYFPHAGEALWAWAALPLHSDALLGLFGAVPWLAALLAAYALARELSAPADRAFLLSLSVLLIPSVTNYMTSGYVDNVTLAGTLLGTLFLARVLRGESRDELVLAIAGFGIAAGTKLTAVPTLLLALGVAAVLAFRQPRDPAPFLLSCIAAAVASPTYLRAWVETGSPTYPVAFQALGRTLFAGNALCVQLWSGRTTPDAMPASIAPLDLVLWLFWRFPPSSDLLNPGFAIVPVLVAGAIGAALLSRKRPGLVALAAAIGAIPVLGLLSRSGLGHRTLWYYSIGRFFTPALALLALPAGVLAAAWIDPALVLVVLAELAFDAPGGFSQGDLAAMVALAPWLLLVAAAGAAAAWLNRRAKRGAAAALLLAAVVPTAGAWMKIRDEARYPVYGAAERGLAWDLHEIDRGWTSAWPVWKALDGRDPRRIAASAGWIGLGDNWYRYPLFGSRWQNDVVYVPITRDGSIVDYRMSKEVTRRADREAWLRRLVVLRVDTLACLPPAPIERSWAESLPEVFHLEAANPKRTATAYRIDGAAAARLLSSRP